MSVTLLRGNSPLLRKDRVEQNYANVMAGPDKIAERTKAIQDNPFALGRWLEMRLFESIVANPDRYTTALGIKLPAGMRFRGSTGHSTIVQTGAYGEMKRVRRASARMNHTQREDFTGQLKERQATVEAVLGEYVLHHTIGLESHPFKDAVEEVIVATTRPYDGKSVTAFGSQKPSIDEREVEQLSIDYGLHGQFSELAEGGLDLMSRGIVIDLSAPSGVVIDISRGSPQLLLTNEALDAPNTGDYSRIGLELHALAEVTNK